MDSPPDDGPCEVTITAPDHAWLQGFVHQLVENGLAAAAHVDLMHTTYRWAGRVNEADEARARLHTRISNVAEISVKVSQEHPFEVGCVTSTPITGGATDYLNWVMKESKGKNG